jgi:hypothetical protein
MLPFAINNEENRAPLETIIKPRSISSGALNDYHATDATTNSVHRDLTLALIGSWG